MIWKIVIGVLLGAGIGGLVGYWGKCRGGTCPFFCNPIGGILLGAVFGGMIGSWFASRTPGPDPLAHVPTIATVQDFEAKVLQSPTPVLVDFFDIRCGPCRRLAPTIARLETEYGGRVAFFRVDVDPAAELARAHGIKDVPTIVVFRPGEAPARLVGVQPVENYRAVLDKALEKQDEEKKPVGDPGGRGDAGRVR